jgi:hypothetical protein
MREQFWSAYGWSLGSVFVSVLVTVVYGRGYS